MGKCVKGIFKKKKKRKKLSSLRKLFFIFFFFFFFFVEKSNKQWIALNNKTTASFLIFSQTKQTSPFLGMSSVSFLFPILLHTSLKDKRSISYIISKVFSEQKNILNSPINLILTSKELIFFFFLSFFFFFP